jgi:hypothetical protein
MSEQVDVLVRYRVGYGRAGEPMSERLFSTHAAAKEFASRKMHEPGWRVDGWPRKVEVTALARCKGESP